MLVLSVFINVDSGLTKDEEKCINARVELAALVNGLELRGVEKVWLTANPGSLMWLYEKMIFIFLQRIEN